MPATLFTSYNHAIRIGDMELDCLKFSVTEEDNSEVKSRNGRPHGITKGNVSGSGEITLSVSGMNRLEDRAAEVGGWDNLPAYDIVVSAESGNERSTKTYHGCQLLGSSGIELDFAGSDASEVEQVVKFLIADKRVSTFSR